MDKLSLDWVLDGLIDAYVDWRISCDDVHDAYRSWTREMGCADRVGFARYMAALDAEEYAADLYAVLVRRAYEGLWGEEPPAEAFDRRARGLGRS